MIGFRPRLTSFRDRFAGVTLASLLFLGWLMLVPACESATPGRRSPGQANASRPRSQVKIDVKSAEKDLLPPPPKTRPRNGPLFADDLAQVPEVALMMEPIPSDRTLQRRRDAKVAELREALNRTLRYNKYGAPESFDAEQLKIHRLLQEAIREASQPHPETAKLIAHINHLNEKKTDRFIELLREHRPDLAGLPFVTGESCRIREDRLNEFGTEMDLVRLALPTLVDREEKGDKVRLFWRSYRELTLNSDSRDLKSATKEELEYAAQMRVTAPMQILATESIEARKGLVSYLATREHAEATRALAKIAIFSAEAELRELARDALKNRPKRDATDILLQGLRYPWPSVAQHASEAVSTLQRTDLIPQLVTLLDEPDPREPVVGEGHNGKVSTLRELVRINHPRNCLLCHAPDDPKAGVLTGGIPRPDRPLSTHGSYDVSELFVRADVTYLRQDFSLLLPVENADPWPKMQRFDFLVRTRILSDDEVKAQQEIIRKRERGYVSPYHRAIQAALQELTDRRAEPTAAAWRKVLDR